MSRHEGCDRCTETAAVVRREVAALTAERDGLRAELEHARDRLKAGLAAYDAAVSPETTEGQR